jgi:hypothetical protein
MAEVCNWFLLSSSAGRLSAASDSRAGPCWPTSMAFGTFVTAPRRTLSECKEENRKEKEKFQMFWENG